MELAAVQFLDDITLDCEDELERDDLRSTSQEWQLLGCGLSGSRPLHRSCARSVQRPLSLRPDVGRLRPISRRHAGAWRRRAPTTSRGHSTTATAARAPPAETIRAWSSRPRRTSRREWISIRSDRRYAVWRTRPVPRSTCTSHPLFSQTFTMPRPGRTSRRLTSSQLYIDAGPLHARQNGFEIDRRDGAGAALLGRLHPGPMLFRLQQQAAADHHDQGDGNAEARPSSEVSDSGC